MVGISRLTPAEAKVIRMLDGLYMNGSHSIDEVAKHFFKTSDEIRAMEAVARKKLAE